MNARLRRADAALVLAALAFAWGLARAGPGSTACLAPSERRAVAGHSVELACLEGAQGMPLRGPARLLVGLPIDPNLADAATLETLPGIGPARALAIVAARARGRFQRVADLARVPGIGPRTLAGMAGMIGVEAAPGDQELRGLGPPRPDPLGCVGVCGSPRPEGDS